MSNLTLIRLRHLFAGADDGHYTLPASVLAARRAVEVLRGAVAPPRHGNEREVAENLVRAASKGKLPPGWADEIRPDITELQHHDAASSVLRVAKDAADDRLLAVTLEAADEIIVSHLRPTLEEAIALVAPHAVAAIDLPWGVPAQLFKPEFGPMIEALGRGAAMYGAIRRAQSVLREATGAPDDEANLLFGEFRSGIRSIWPTFRTHRQTLPPWGDLEGPSRFAWLVANAADDLWMPTAAECDDAYHAKVRESGLLQAGMPA